MSEMDNLYGVGGQVYEFIDASALFYKRRGLQDMARRAQELLGLIAAHDKEVERITQEVTAECRAELAATAPTDVKGV